VLVSLSLQSKLNGTVLRIFHATTGLLQSEFLTMAPARFRWTALALLVATLMTHDVNGFGATLLSQPQNSLSTATQHAKVRIHQFRPLWMAGDDDEDRLSKFGYTDDEIRRSRKASDKEKIKVNVNVVDDIDPFTLTAVGFGLIALNFFVLANIGDGGISGLVATVINTMRD
jgi:hypothetical protein